MRCGAGAEQLVLVRFQIREKAPVKRLSFIALAGAVVLLLPASIAASPRPTIAVVMMKLAVKPVQTKYGMLGGYNPTILTVHVGDKVRWQNLDAENHTATSRGFAGDGRVETGTAIGPAPWSSGDVAAKQQSRVFVATHAGVYHYSCGYHSKLGQRGVIVVLP
jgi:plastocyanin